ncbi:hypothetical protein [Muricoccus aerilatus]|uniref:hypothetical protein n=1 Tax=Muricoccus aerilatus TaxID=452982 RepID=UPI0005C15BF6|nr:hypothetical protein [Roseomonas aerilata]
MPLPPTPFDGRPNPLDATIEPAEVFQHPAAGEVGKWIDKALHGPPSPGAVGRMELLRHWERLPADKRRMLLLLAREMSQAEQSRESISED